MCVRIEQGVVIMTMMVRVVSGQCLTCDGQGRRWRWQSRISGLCQKSYLTAPWQALLVAPCSSSSSCAAQSRSGCCRLASSVAA
jgi:hypothetical protein